MFAFKLRKSPTAFRAEQTKAIRDGVRPRGAIQLAREASLSNRARLRSTPQAYPEVDPSLRITRWHGMATAILFAAQAPATARTALGAPIRCASSIQSLDSLGCAND